MDTLLNQGLLYEKYVKDTIKSNYSEVWIWNEIPKTILLELEFINGISRNCDDIGCDILAKNFDNTYDYIQCKNYSTLGIDNTISICDLAGFYNFVAGVLSSQILCRKKRIKYVNLPYIKISKEDIKPRYKILKTKPNPIIPIPSS